ncbi:MAG: PAS domain-containing protein, partial [Anaerolineae bacterium]
YEWSTTDAAGTRYFQTSLSPMFDEAGQVVGLVGIGRDVTRIKQMEQALARSEALLRAIFDNIHEGIVVTDLEGRILEINPVALQTLAPRTREEVLGKSIVELLPLPSDFIRQENEKILQTVRQGRPYEAERVFPGLNGREVIRLSRYLPLKDASGKMWGIISIIRDVTEERRLEEERRRMDKLEALGLLAGGIAHDFNNLLTAVLGNISLARLQLPADHEAQKLLAEAERASLRTRDLTQQLLTFAKGGEPIRELATISDLLHDITRFILRGSNVRLAFTIAPDLWPVEVDKGQFGQVVQNIVLNARQAMPAGGTLYLTAENVTIEPPGQGIIPPGAYVRITFRDEGIGIPREHLARIFDPYFTTKQEGSGLGLAVVHSIVRRHGGYITVDSVLGRGATFTIYLPAQPEKRIQREAPRPAPAVPEKYAGRILIMDDEAMVRELLRRYLSQLGFECEEASDGRQMLEKYQEARQAGRPFDLVIMDLTIPGGMGGKDAVVRLRQLDPGARAVVISGYSNDPIMARYTEYGFDGVVAKPLNLEHMKAVLLKVLEAGGERSPAPAEAAPAGAVDKPCESDPRLFVYQIDAGDVITTVNDAWDEFALENEAPHLTGQGVIGRSLWDFIAGEETRHLYRILFQRVREGKRPISIPFRCDAPDCRRYMEMQMIPDNAGGITFANRVLRVERRPAVRLLEQGAPRSPDFVTMCGWCKRVRLPDDRWVEVEEAIRVLHLFDERAVPQISHGICPECHDRVLGVWEERRAG